MAGNLISIFSLFTVKSVPSIYPLWWFNTGVNGSNATISSGNHECLQNKAQQSGCGAESWWERFLHQNSGCSQAPKQVVTSRTTFLGVARTWWRSIRSTEQTLEVPAPSGGCDHTFLAIAGEHQHWLINYSWKEPCMLPAPACTVRGTFVAWLIWGGKRAQLVLLHLSGLIQFVPHCSWFQAQEQGHQGTFLQRNRGHSCKSPRNGAVLSKLSWIKLNFS